MTTIPLKAAKEALAKENLGIQIVGGKGKESRAILQIPRVGGDLGLTTQKIDRLSYASRLTCKVDSTELQDAHQLYFHAMLLDEHGNYVTINQKMSVPLGTVRRFHWAPNPRQFVEEPYAAAVGSEQKAVLDLTSRRSRECRSTMIDIVRDERPEKIQKTILTLDRRLARTKLLSLAGTQHVRLVKLPVHLAIPRKLSLEALRAAHELGKHDFESLLGVRGIGPATVRGLAYIADLVYGAESSFRDPIRYTFAFGTKVNVPYPVDKPAMRAVADILRAAVQEARLGKRQKLAAIKRLRRFVC
jgi:hypothetical protein